MCILSPNCILWASLVAQRLKCLPGMRETRVRSLDREDPLEKEMATHSSTLAGKPHGGRSLVGYSLLCIINHPKASVQFSSFQSLSRVRLFETLWTVAYQAPSSMGFSRQEYWSRLPFPSPGDLPHPGVEHRSPAFQADTLTSEPPGKPPKNKV